MIRVSHPTGILNGSIGIEGSKSIANRALLLSALYAPNTRITGIPSANDTRIMQDLLEKISHPTPGKMHIDVKDAGTVCRFLLPVLAFTEGEFVLEGTSRMAERPLLPLIDALRNLGAHIEGQSLPLYIYGTKSAKQDYAEVRIDTSASSQFASALLMILPHIANEAQLILEGTRLSLPYIDMTIHVMQQLGLDVKRDGAFITYHRRLTRTGIHLDIETDYSSLAFWVGITALSAGGEIAVNAGHYRQSVQGDSVVVERALDKGLIEAEIQGSQIVMRRFERPRNFHVVQLDFSDTPDLAIPELIMYSARGYRCTFSGIESLEQKESRRFSELVKKLEAFGITISRTGDHFVTSGDFKFPTDMPVIDPALDHRLAMGFAMLGIQQPIVIEEPDVVAKSYRRFWDDLRKVNFELTEIT